MAQVWFSVHTCSTTEAYIRQGSVKTKRTRNAFIRSSSGRKFFFFGCHNTAYDSVQNLNSYFERAFECFKQFREIAGDLEEDPNIGQPWIALNAETVAEVRQLVERHDRVILELVDDQCTLTRRRFVRFIIKLWEKGSGTRSAFCTVSRMKSLLP